MEIISRPRENFFKVFQQRDKFLWVVMHPDIKKNTQEMAALFKKCKVAFESLNLPDHGLPICANYFEYKMWSKEYMVKVAADESIGEDLFSIL